MCQHGNGTCVVTINGDLQVTSLHLTAAPETSLQCPPTSSGRLLVRLQVVAVNGVAERVSVVQRDAGLLERGKHVRRLGVNIVVADFFDAGAGPGHKPRAVVCIIMQG